MQEVKAGSRPPWVGLAAAVWVQVAAGAAYTFPLYSPSLKAVLGLGQQQLALLGVANDVGENFGLVAGLVSARFRTWVVLLAGAACCFVGFGVLWLALSRTITGLPFWLLWIALCIGTNSSAWLITGVLVTNMRNFPVSRGTVSGILKGYVGLSGSIFTGLYASVLGSSPNNLILFLSIGLPAICLAMMSLVRPCTPSTVENSTESCHFVVIQVLSIILGLYLLVFTFLNSYYSLNDVGAGAFFGGIVLLLLAPLAIPIKMTIFKPKREHASVTVSMVPSVDDLEDDTATKPLLDAADLLNLQEFSDDVSYADMLLAVGEGAVKEKKRPRRGDDFEVHEAFVKADFWLLFLAFFIGAGTGVTVLNNLAQIGSAAGVDDPTILLCLFSFGNFLGRLGGGAVSEHFVRTRMLPRPFWMMCTQITMVIAYLFYAWGLRLTLNVSTALLGVCYGAQTAVMIPTTSELFGLNNFGTFFNFMLLGNPLGATLFSSLLAGYLYDQEAARQHSVFLHEDSSSCYGPHCFRLTFFILAAVCSLGTLLCIILTERIRPVYQMLYASGSFRHPKASSSLH
ncbi:protein NUCLEAR FUSION DEFECTIVE 4-like [Zingiber officinale]|uniref:Nodulin-like domain-containing protein n=1 Tax=Zingiber officinale TaxID=94328 RepID=A0A8J5M9F8_ZINOF|nr:protein NUCLEAR FUSION DEFECTIVE 4-like [Zingiber officinale]KAG6537317.1 hypothetical protein ZIOFF_002404 [Zingiber officinale]